MKKLIFIDNDQERDVQADETSHVKRQLRYHFDIDYKDLQIVRGFYFKCKEEGDDKQYDMLFNSNSVIVTYSMYTATHYGSLFTFNHFLKVAGRNGVKNMTYINVSSEDYMIKALEYFNDEKFFLNILKAVAMNNLISYSYDLNSLTKVVVDLTLGYKHFKVIPITMEEFNIMLDKEES